MLENLTDIQCPSCFEWFSFTLQQDDLVVGSVEMDYDCEVCCRPMRVIVSANEAYAIGMDD
ncbi:MAG: CPXCG motif-containing cysteine-rich protein [Akkermansiaceae bacterium]